MTKTRKEKLEKNFKRMFWVKAFSNVKFINIVLSIFYIARGITLSEIFYLTIVWSVTNLIFEVPSSYLADRWGRKKTIVTSVILFFLYYIIFFFGHGFAPLALGIFLYALSFSLLTGTEDALIYDTARELGKEKKSLSELGKYYSASHLFKIVVPVVGAFLVKDLLESQFQLIIILDIVVSLSALLFAVRIVEPNHHMDVEQMEAGVIKDAWKLLRSDNILSKAIFGKIILFIASFILWTYHQVFFVNLGLSIIVLGIGWSIGHTFAFLANRNINKLTSSRTLGSNINMLNFIVVVFLIVLALGVSLSVSVYFILILFLLQSHLEVLRWPLYSEFFNRQSFSYNRATTLSLTNFVKSVLDLPLLFIASILIGMNYLYPFIFSVILGLVVLFFFKLPKTSYEQKTS